MSRAHLPGFLAVLIAAATTAPSAASAQRPEVQEALALFEDLRYDRARQSFERALDLAGNRPEDLATIHLHLGVLHGAADHEDQAEDHFRRALAVNPLVELPSGQPPKITRPFSSARQFWGEARLRIVHAPPEGWTEDSPAALRFEVVDDRMEMVTGARLVLWSEELEEERTYRQDGGGPFIFPVPPELVVEDSVVRYRVELLSTRTSVLTVLDDAETNAVAVGPPLPPDVIHSGSTQPPPRLYERWWFWTIIGVVVAGAAAGTAIALTVPQDGIDFGSPEVVY